MRLAAVLVVNNGADRGRARVSSRGAVRVDRAASAQALVPREELDFIVFDDDALEALAQEFLARVEW